MLDGLLCLFVYFDRLVNCVLFDVVEKGVFGYILWL